MEGREDLPPRSDGTTGPAMARFQWGGLSVEVDPMWLMERLAGLRPLFQAETPHPREGSETATRSTPLEVREGLKRHLMELRRMEEVLRQTQDEVLDALRRLDGGE